MCQVKNTNFLLQSDHGDKRFTCAFYKPKKSEEKISDRYSRISQSNWKCLGEVDSTKLTKSEESAKNYNCFSSFIKHPENYPSTYSDTFSPVVSV